MQLRSILKAKGNSVHTIGPQETLAEVVQRLVMHNCGSLVVCDDEGQMLGIITERDILRASAEMTESLDHAVVETRMTVDVVTGSPDDKIDYVMGLLTEKRIRHLPVVDDGRLVGLISIGDVVKAQHHLLSMENHMLKSYIQS